MVNLRLALRAELEAAGLFTYTPGRVYGKFLFLFLLLLGSFAAFFLTPWWWLKVPLFCCGAVLSVAVVMFGHESGHGAISRNAWLNDPLGLLTFPLFAGLSMTYWKHKHNTLHHSYPNVAGRDPDLKLAPFALYPEQRAPRRGMIRWVQRYQGLLFWPLSLMVGFVIRYDSLHFHLHEGRQVVSRRARALDLSLLALHYLLWLVAPTVLFGVPLGQAALFYFFWTLGVGLLLSTIFAPAHMTQPMFRDYDDNFMLQLQSTQNLRTNRLFSYLLIGLDYQVEHHLFQRMSHQRVRHVAPIVRAFCARHGLPYQSQGWGEALWSLTRCLGRLPDNELLERPVAAPRTADRPDPVGAHPDGQGFPAGFPSSPVG